MQSMLVFCLNKNGKNTSRAILPSSIIVTGFIGDEKIWIGDDITSTKPSLPGDDKTAAKSS